MRYFEECPGWGYSNSFNENGLFDNGCELNSNENPQFDGSNCYDQKGFNNPGMSYQRGFENGMEIGMVNGYMCGRRRRRGCCNRH